MRVLEQILLWVEFCSVQKSCWNWTAIVIALRGETFKGWVLFGGDSSSAVGLVLSYWPCLTHFPLSSGAISSSLSLLSSAIMWQSSKKTYQFYLGTDTIPGWESSQQSSLFFLSSVTIFTVLFPAYSRPLRGPVLSLHLHSWGLCWTLEWTQISSFLRILSVHIF